MKLPLLYTKSFMRDMRKLGKGTPAFAEQIRSTLELLGEDIFHPLLGTHKLKGELQEVYACSAGYDLRILFQIVPHQNAKAALLLTVGTHDEVY